VNVLSLEMQTRVIAALTEGMSIRATQRITGVEKKTIQRLALRVGQGCANLLDGMMRDLQVNVVELDEQWSFVGCKQKNVTEATRDEKGDAWLFIALDATSKAVFSWALGKRSGELTRDFANDMRARLLTRPQVTADGFPAYTDAVTDAFASDVDFAQLVKHYDAPAGNQAAVRYSPGKIRAIEKNVVCGNPDESKISTSYVERFNLSTRMHMRRFTRLTNAFSKKQENHHAAVALHLAYYNLVRLHETIRCTPAMALGVANHPWTLAELIQIALAAKPTPPVYVPPQSPLPGLSAAKAKKAGGRRTSVGLTVIKGGRK